MTKYILAGGNDLEHPEYFAQLAKATGGDEVSLRILSCWFSESDEKAKKKFELFKQLFQTHFHNDVSVVFASVTTFIEQIRQSDVIYLHGGHTDLIFERMSQFPDIETEFKDKIVIGSSAGANYLSYAYFSSGRDVVEKGAGIVDVSVLVHYGITGWKDKKYRDDIWQFAVKRLKELGPNKEIIYLPEGIFTIIEKQ